MKFRHTSLSRKTGFYLPFCKVMIVLFLLTRTTNEPKVLPFFIQCTSMCIVHRFEDRGSKDKRKSRFEKFKTGHPSGCQRPLSYCLPYYPVNDVKDIWFRYVLLSDNGVAWLGTLPEWLPVSGSISSFSPEIVRNRNTCTLVSQLTRWLWTAHLPKNNTPLSSVTAGNYCEWLWLHSDDLSLSNWPP